MTLKLGTEIPGTSADGNITTLWVPTIKDIKAPTMAELEAGTDISNYVMLGGWSFDPSQDAVSDQRENVVQDFGAPGRKSVGDISIEVIDNTNTEHQEQNEAVTLMHEGASGYIVRRRGMPLSVCHDEQTPFHFTADVGICQISLMQSLKLDEWKKDHADENELKQSALTVGIKPR